MALLESDERRLRAEDQQKPARDACSRSRLDDAISLNEVLMSADPREDLALLRFRIIGEAINPRLTPAERGHLVRELANQPHEHPDGSSWTYPRLTLDRWIRAFPEHGLDARRPPPPAAPGVVRRHPELADEA